MKISKKETILKVNILKEGKEYIAYSPALDISSCGKDEIRMDSKPSKYPSKLNHEELDWLSLSPAKRVLESAKLWKFYLAIGGKLDSQPDPQGPFNFPKTKS